MAISTSSRQLTIAICGLRGKSRRTKLYQFLAYCIKYLSSPRRLFNNQISHVRTLIGRGSNPTTSSKRANSPIHLNMKRHDTRPTISKISPTNGVKRKGRRYSTISKVRQTMSRVNSPYEIYSNMEAISRVFSAYRLL